MAELSSFKNGGKSLNVHRGMAALHYKQRTEGPTPLRRRVTLARDLIRLQCSLHFSDNFVISKGLHWAASVALVPLPLVSLFFMAGLKKRVSLNMHSRTVFEVAVPSIFPGERAGLCF
ncbi:hypothetical protein ACU8KH_05846 [Lachancea thermotolerans]